jgi:hypothetical protein
LRGLAEEEYVPLSEHEQRLLEQMERALYAEDPKFASSLRGSDLRSHYRRRVVQAVLGFVLGIALLMTGVVVKAVPVSVLGFVVMLAAAFLTVSSWRRIPGAGEAGAARAAAPPPSRGSKGARLGRSGRAARAAQPKTTFMARMEQRWRRRRDDPGR